MSDLIDRKKALDKIWEARRSQQMLDNTQVADLVMHGLYIAVGELFGFVMGVVLTGGDDHDGF